MATGRHIEIGVRGENLAVDWLVSSGYHILSRNWKAGRTEIDIICVKEGQLHFIEIKTRKTDLFGHPEQRITNKKIRDIARAGELYIDAYPEWSEFIIDVLSIILPDKGEPAFYFIEDIRL